MSPENVFDYSILEYSTQKRAEEVVAQFSISDDAVMHIVANERFARQLEKTTNLIKTDLADGTSSFNIDLNEAPIEIVAMALGLPGNNPDFRASLNKANGGYVSYAQIFNLALEGHPLQSGRIESATPKNRLAGIDEHKVIHLDDRLDKIPNLPGILGAVRESEFDLHVQNVMAKKGNALIPGYIVTAAEGVTASNIVDRISLMAAYLEEAGKVNDSKADKLLKVGVLSDGRPYAVFSDSTRNMMNIKSIENSVRNPNKVLLVVNREELYAKKGMELNPKCLREQEASFATHFQINTLNRVVEDRMGTMASPTAYFKEDGKAHVTVPKVRGETSIESFIATKNVFSANGKSLLSIAQMQQNLPRTENEGLLDTVRMRIGAMGKMAMDIRRELEDRIQMASVQDKPVDRFYSNEISIGM